MLGGTQLRIGIDVGGTKISGVLMAPDGTVLSARRQPSPRDDYGATLNAIQSLVSALGVEAACAGGGCPVGVGTPGAWQPGSRTMKNCNSTWLNGQPLLDDLRTRLGPQVRIANDADCFALSEATDGAGAGRGVVFGVILGTGVGGGLVINGALLRGPRGLAGEWGHIPLPYFRHPPFGVDASRPPDPVGEQIFQLESGLAHRPCYCGRLNCIETFLSGPGLMATHEALWNEKRTPEAIADGQREEERLTLLVYANMLARSLAQVVNLVDPDCIVLGGGVSNIQGVYARVAIDLPRFVFAAGPGDPKETAAPAVRPARWGDDSGVRGAAWLWPAIGE